MIPETIAIIGGGAAFIMLAAAMWKYAGEGSFLYANARLVGRLELILERNKLERLMYATSLVEFVNMLKDTEYANLLEGIGKVTELNIALEKGLINSIKEIKEISPKKFKRIFDVYMRIYEAKIIKIFFRARFADIEIMEELLEPFESMNALLVKQLKETKTIADMRVVLEGTSYAGLFDKEYKTIEEFDAGLDKRVMGQIDDMLRKSRFYDKEAIMGIFERRNEIKGILTLLKLRIRELPKEKQEGIVELRCVDVDKAIEAKDMLQFVNVFEGTEYGEAMKKALDEFRKKDDYYSFERELWRHYHSKVVEKDLGKPIGPYPIISYITKKEMEQRNIMIIAKGIMTGKAKEEIKGMMI
jgi:V/A-type H+-transporting ATPase subunit C